MFAIPIAAGMISPAPTPCIARAAISQAASGASALSSDAAPNVARPASRTRLRPSMSARRPAATTTAARLSM